MKGLVAALVAWGPLGLFLFAILDGAGLPSPGGLDWLVVFLAIKRPEWAYRFAGLAIVGSILGGGFLYWLARRGGETILKKYRARSSFVRFEKWFQHYGLLTVFIPALIPIPMPLKFFVLCAGVFKIPPLNFFVVILLARVPRYFGLAYLGSELGLESAPWLKTHVWAMFGIAAALFVLLYLLIVVAERRRRLTGLE
ncbi:MAG: VTT domain-containing protein [Acidobacteriota bacterium]|nr:VTT domain-containing protein [Acidobacteriota bacterium]